MNAWIKEWNINECMNERMKHKWMHERMIHKWMHE